MQNHLSPDLKRKIAFYLKSIIEKPRSPIIKIYSDEFCFFRKAFLIYDLTDLILNREALLPSLVELP